jgi:hypothetical protein
MNDIGRLVLALVGSVMSLAILSVVVSQSAQTGALITDSGNALGTIIGAADAPVTSGGSSGLSNILNQTRQL